MAREPHPGPGYQAPARSSLWGIAQGVFSGHEISRPFSALPHTGRQPIQNPLQEAAFRNGSRRRDSDARSPQRPEHGENKSRREGGEHKRQMGHPEGDLWREMQGMRAEISRLLEENRQHKAEVSALQTRQIPGPLDFTGNSFGITANLTSTGDVRRMMEDLDAEIFQTAAALSEFDFRGQSSRSYPQGRGVDPDLHNRLIPVLGSHLMGLLSATGRSRPVPAILVQIALQTVMSAWSCRNLGAWILEGSGQFEEFLTELYGEIRRAENPKDAARWRTMTRKRLIKRASLSDVGASLLQHIVDVVILTKSGSAQPLSRKSIEAAFEDRIEVVQRLVLDLNRDIGTRIVSDELAAVLVDPGIRFDPRTMENMWPQEEDGKFRASDVVVCTTGLGLQNRVQSGAVLFVKPKVLVRSTLGQLMT